MKNPWIANNRVAMAELHGESPSSWHPNVVFVVQLNLDAAAFPYMESWFLSFYRTVVSAMLEKKKRILNVILSIYKLLLESIHIREHPTYERMNEWVPFLFQQCNDGYWRMGSVFRRKSNTVVQFASVIYLPRSTVLRWIWWWLWLVFFAGQWMTVSSTRIVIFFIYVYSMVWALFPLFGWGGYGKEWIVHS